MDLVQRMVDTYVIPYANELKTTWIALAIISFGILATGSTTASYGRHFSQSSIIPSVHGKLGWLTMEIISPIMALSMFRSYKIAGPSLSKGVVLLGLWLVHYSNRAIISVVLSPHMKSSRLDIVLMSMLFNTVNGAWMGHDLGQQNSEKFVLDPRTSVGLALFILGLSINVSCDYHLQSLRRQTRKRGEYVLSDWGLYKWIVSPNYSGEIMEWIGYALMSGRDSGWAFVVWSISNLAPRARANLDWYRAKFGGRIGNRKALIPGIY